MPTIVLDCVLSTGLDPSLAGPRVVEIETMPRGEGAFGAVYGVVSVDGVPGARLVLKLLHQVGSSAHRRGFATIQELQRRLQHEHRALTQQGTGLLDRFPALAGVPQFSFEGRLAGRPVLGYAAADLSAAGMEDFGRVLADDAKARRFQSLPFARRLALAAQLIDAFHFLSTKTLFIHADIKPEAIFVDAAGRRLAVIDFDSGAVANHVNDRPSTFGTRQDWLAPEIVRQLDGSTKVAHAIVVNLQSDVWSVNVGVHCLLFGGLHPLFFLTELSDRAVTAYFRQYRWPAVSPSFPYFNPAAAAAHARYVAVLRQVPAVITRQLDFTINRGFLRPSERTTYGQWKTVLGGLSRPAVVGFSADRQHVTDSLPVTLRWQVAGAMQVTLSGVGDVSEQNEASVNVRADTSFTLTVTGANGHRISRSLMVTVSKEPPRIGVFASNRRMLSDATPATLTWQVTGAETLEIDQGVGRVTGQSHVDVSPRRDTLYTLRATSFSGVVAHATLSIRVSNAEPIVRRFDVTPMRLWSGQPVEVRWAVENAARVWIDPGIGVVGTSGHRRLHPVLTQEIVLRAETMFGVATSRRVTVSVLKTSSLTTSTTRLTGPTALLASNPSRVR